MPKNVFCEVKVTFDVQNQISSTLSPRKCLCQIPSRCSRDLVFTRMGCTNRQTSQKHSHGCCQHGGIKTLCQQLCSLYSRGQNLAGCRGRSSSPGSTLLGCGTATQCSEQTTKRRKSFPIKISLRIIILDIRR